MVIAARQEGIAVGMLMDVVLGVPRVVYPGNPLDQAVEARTTVALGDGDIGCEVAISFENGDAAKPIILGKMIRRAPVSLALPAAAPR